MTNKEIELEIENIKNMLENGFDKLENLINDIKLK